MPKPDSKYEVRTETADIAAQSTVGWQLVAEGSSSDQEPDELVGSVLAGTYWIERVIGKGGMGTVYLSHHVRLKNKQFAVKVLLPEYARNPEVLARFQREAEAAACIGHPNVVDVYDVDRTPQGQPYLVCEYLVGVDLGKYLREHGRLSVPAAVSVALQVCDAIEAAHARGVIHRDLKPENVFLLGAGEGKLDPNELRVKLLDLGLSRFVDRSEGQLTKTGIIMGTPGYMAPEQARGQHTDQRTDIYGIGAILYAALTGRAPFVASTPQMTVLAVLGEEPPRPRALEPSIPEGLELVVQRAMAKDPSDRYPDVESLRAALRPFAAPAARRLRNDRDAPGAGPESGRRPNGEARAARPRLVALLGLTGLGLALLSGEVLGGVELLRGGTTFTRSELLILMVALLGTAVTPGLLVVRQVRRAWNNSARVVGMLEALRAPVVAALVAYGSASLVIRVADNLGARFFRPDLLGHEPGIAWKGFGLILPAIALLAAGTIAIRRRLLAENARAWRRGASAVLVVAAICAVALLGQVSLHWRARSTLAPAGPSAAGSVDAAQRERSRARQTASSLSASASGSPRHSPAADRTRSERATDQELAAAVASGEEALRPLAERFPEDPRTLRALLLAYASRASGHADAMLVARRLFRIAPEETKSPDLRVIITRAAEAPGPGSQLAFELMANYMGSEGPDLLYDIWLNRPKIAHRARQLLMTEAVRARFSPALRVAYELRTAESCAARLPLLERATQVGDERSLHILFSLSTGTRRGCGRAKRQPCPPPCPREAEQFRQAAARISARPTVR